MEGIREQLVKKPVDSQDKIKTALVLVGSLLLAIIVVLLFNILIGSVMMLVALIFAGLIMWGGYWLTGEFSVEYEYCYSNGELSVDKIINQRRRKSMCSVDLKRADAFYKNPAKLPDATVISAVGELEDKYAISYNDPTYGPSVLVFTPDEKMLDAIKPYLPRII